MIKRSSVRVSFEQGEGLLVRLKERRSRRYRKSSGEFTTRGFCFVLKSRRKNHLLQIRWAGVLKKVGKILIRGVTAHIQKDVL